MSYTRKKYHDNVIDLAASYGIQVKLGQKHIWAAIQRAIDEVYRHTMPQRPRLWEKTAAGLQDGSPLPSDYVAFLDAYILDGSNNRIGFRTPPIQELAAMKHNSAALATADEPALFIWSELVSSRYQRQIHTVPAAITAINLIYMAKPIRIYDPQDLTIPDTIESGVPDDLDGLVVRGAFERLTILLVEEAEALQITQDQLEKAREENFKLYTDHLERVVEGPRGSTLSA